MPVETKAIQKFLLDARTKTYAASIGKQEAVLPGSVQYGFTEGEFRYQDIYYLGNRIFSGLETVFVGDSPVWTMSYFGDFKQLTEEETDLILRKALIANWETVRLGGKVEWESAEYKYFCDGNGSIDEIQGTETIHKDGKLVYFFNYAGGLIG